MKRYHRGIVIKKLSFIFNDHKLTIRETQENDLPRVTSIINAAYKMWNSIGFDKANQTPEMIRPFALKDGHVVCDSENKIIAAFNICPVQPIYENGILSVNRTHKIDRTVLDEKIISAEKLLGKKLAYSYGLCVDSEYAKLGLGEKLVKVGESFLYSNHFQGILFETGRDAKWLVEWYQRLGFIIIGNSNDAISPLPLIMMFKKITRQNS